MVKRSAGTAIRFALLVLALDSILGCNDAFSTSSEPQPFVYLVVSRGALPGSAVDPADSSVKALLLTVGSSGASFRRAEQFQLVRTRDDSLFMIQESQTAAQGVFDARHGLRTDDANYVLPFSPVSGLGARDVEPLNSYRLRIETGGNIVTGNVAVPATPVPRLVVVDGARSVVFPPAIGAAGYVVEADTETWPATLITDTVVHLRYDRGATIIPPNPRFRVIAVDPNLFNYVADTTVASAGLNGALGVFGAATAATLDLPPP
jgi:hypothetical protein